MSEELFDNTINTPQPTDAELIALAKKAFSAGDILLAEELITPLKRSSERQLLMAELCAIKGDYSKAKVLYHNASVSYRSSKARLALNSLCLELAGKSADAKSGVLKDNHGSEISFNRKGVPVEGRLIYEDGKAVFDIRLNVVQRRLSHMKLEKPARAIIQGIKQWQGSYTVFGGYPIDVRIKCTTDLNKHNSLIINILDDQTTDSVTSILKKLGKKGQRSADILNSRRQTAASFGRVWRLNSIKYINLFEKDLSSVPHCKFISRHEFGHILGLDDMYAEKSDGREGVTADFAGLAPFHIKDSLYNMIMCSVDAPVIYKDIEMALLAYRDNEQQCYQLKFGKGIISKALI